MGTAPGARPLRKSTTSSPDEHGRANHQSTVAADLTARHASARAVPSIDHRDRDHGLDSPAITSNLRTDRDHAPMDDEIGGRHHLGELGRHDDHGRCGCRAQAYPRLKRTTTARSVIGFLVWTSNRELPDRLGRALAGTGSKLLADACERHARAFIEIAIGQKLQRLGGGPLGGEIRLNQLGHDASRPRVGHRACPRGRTA